MGVPFHDERDCAFALSNSIEMVQVMTVEDKMCNCGDLNGLSSEDAKKEILMRLGTKSEQTTQYRLRDWLISRQRYWGVPIPIMFNDKGEAVGIENLPLLLPEIDDTEIIKSFCPLSKVKEFLSLTVGE